jgi:membrane protease YdiL (CAAX protease family)
VTKRKSRQKPAGPYLEPYLAYLVFAAVGVGSYRLAQDVRLVLLWLVLLIVVLLHVEQHPVKLQYTLTQMGQGAVVGAVLSVPLLLLAWEPLQATVARLYPLGSDAMLFQGVVLVAVPIEGAFFRGILRREHGFWTATGLYGLSAAVFFLPIVSDFPVVLLTVMAGMAMLGVVYGYVALRYGLAASLACQAVVNLGLFVAPAWLAPAV